MGKRGPAKTPTAILERRGSWRAKERTGEPEFEDDVPQCPLWLRAEAKEAWEEIVPRLAAVPGLLKSVDRNALSRYCQTWAKWRACEDFLAKHGDVYPIKDAFGETTGMKQYPQVLTSIKLDQSLKDTEKQFGMTASARAGLSVGSEVQTPADAADAAIREALARAN